tara:strand:+ start:49 stop:537 length:489 start_codon:yes stop_codon:yes gene_type:complete
MGNYANINQRLKSRHEKLRCTKSYVDYGIVPTLSHYTYELVDKYWDKYEQLSGIYFITYKGDDRCVKIGCSTKLPSRLSSFLTGTWRDIDVLCILNTSKREVTYAENYAHKLLESERCIREWFYLTDDVRSKINTIANMIKFKPFLLLKGGVPHFYETTNRC